MTTSTSLPYTGAVTRWFRTKALTRLQQLFANGAVLVLFLLFWETAPRWGLVDPVFLPPFSKVVLAWHALLTSGTLAEHVYASLHRSFLGLGLALITAVPLGLVIGSNRKVATYLGPLLEIFRNTAALALLPVFILILGIGETSKVALVQFACTWPILLNTVSGVRNVDPLLVKAARSMALGPVALFIKVILPAAVPTIFTGIRLAAASSVLVLIAAEMVGARAGLGYLVTSTQLNFEIPQMYAGIVTISLLGLALNKILVLIETRLTHYKE